MHPNIEVDQLTDTNDRDEVYNESISDNIITSRQENDSRASIGKGLKRNSFH